MKKAGVAILFNKKLDFKVNSIIGDLSRRYIFINGLMQSNNITLVNILYATKEDNPPLFISIESKLSDYSSSVIILGGDMN